mmetsp:Transcript_25535/g.54513  ORF Transcript_25535/g.54513 Transcript_25535/m.54513 type:complete len:81 (-) Transcript_25535:1788-2030(-)
MLSAFRMVLSLWAMITVVLCLVEMIFSRASCTTSSDWESSAEVASSNIKILGSPTKTRAMAMRCFCPPESWDPLSPTFVL